MKMFSHRFFNSEIKLSLYDRFMTENNRHSTEDGRLIKKASNKNRQKATRSANCRPCKKKITAEQTGKRCWRCGDPVWRSDLIYCWECYKYEKYESK